MHKLVSHGISDCGVKYTMACVETEYRGYKFRSRLEAKWAAFFDLLGWAWEYEPIEFDGWFPDFAIFGDTGNIVYVEVKPVTVLPVKLEARLEAVNIENEILVCGMVWHNAWLYDRLWFGDIGYGRWSSGNGKIGFCHGHNSYVDRISGGYDGGSYGEIRLRTYEIANLWAEACNIVQWKKK